jgi:hypothetical protein
MAAEDPNNSSKTQAASAPVGVAKPGASDSFSLDDIDKIIEAEDPQFKSDLDALKAQKIEGSESLQNLGVAADDEALSPDDEPPSLLYRLRQAIVRRLLQIGPFLRRIAQNLKSLIILLIKKFIQFLRHGLPERIRYLKGRLVAFFKVLKEILKKFWALSRIQKISLGFMFLASMGALFFLSKTVTGHWLPRYVDSLPRSLAQGANFYRGYDRREDLIDLFVAFPEVEYDVLLKRLVVNLRASESSGKNPMGAFEVYVGVDSQDTAVEVKDREREFTDVIQRALEKFSYDECVTKVGKAHIKEVLREDLNKVLNQGRVSKIYFNTFVVYSGN